MSCGKELVFPGDEPDSAVGDARFHTNSEKVFPAWHPVLNRCQGN